MPAARNCIELALEGDLPGALAWAARVEDPEDRYLDLVLAAVACVRGGDLELARGAAARAADNYRPIVEEGLYFVYARYLRELAEALYADDVARFVEAMEPEVMALGALPAAADPPLPFLSLYNDLFCLSYGWGPALDHARQHAAAHLLLGDLSRRMPTDASVDAALSSLAAAAAAEAAELAINATAGADPYTRDRLRRALLRHVAAVRSLFDRHAAEAAMALAALPFDALSRLPRGMRLEALQVVAAALETIPGEHRAALYPRFLEAAHPPGQETGSMLRRQASAIARITATFIAVSQVAAPDLAGLLVWFLEEEAFLGEGAAEESARNFAKALRRLGSEGGPWLERLLDWTEREAPSAAVAVLAAWASAEARSPSVLRDGWAFSAIGAWGVVREGTPREREEWAAEAIGSLDWQTLVHSADQGEQRAIAELLTWHSDPLEDPDEAAEIARLIRGNGDGGPYAGTLDLLGPEPSAYALAVLFDARVASRGYAATEHDQALRLIVAWALTEGPNQALRLATGFASRNHVSWLLGSLLADGAAKDLDREIVVATDPHPFLLGAYILETNGPQGGTKAPINSSEDPISKEATEGSRSEREERTADKSDESIRNRLLGT